MKTLWLSKLGAAFAMLASLNGCGRGSGSTPKSLSVVPGTGTVNFTISRVTGSDDTGLFVPKFIQDNLCNSGVFALNPDLTPVAGSPLPDDNTDCKMDLGTIAYTDGDSARAYQIGNNKFVLDGSRARYPLGYRTDVNTQAKIVVNVCSADIAAPGEACTAESQFFAPELAALNLTDPAKIQVRITQAIGDALKFLTYQDAGLATCYANALATTDRFEAGTSHSPYRSNLFNTVRAIRGRKQAALPIVNAEHEKSWIQALRTKINLLSDDVKASYVQRQKLQNRLGYQWSSKTANFDSAPVQDGDALISNANPEYEPTGVLANLPTSTCDADAAIDHGVPCDLKQIDELMLESAAAVFRLTGDGSASLVKDTTQAATPAQTAYLNLLSQAVLLAKATKLDPAKALNDFETANSLLPDCDTYANFDVKAGANKRAGYAAALKDFVATSTVNAAPQAVLSVVDASGQRVAATGNLAVMNSAASCTGSANYLNLCGVTWTNTSATPTDFTRYTQIRISAQAPAGAGNDWSRSVTIADWQHGGSVLNFADLMAMDQQGFFTPGLDQAAFYVEGLTTTGTYELLYSGSLKATNLYQSALPLGPMTGYASQNGYQVQIGDLDAGTVASYDVKDGVTHFSAYNDRPANSLTCTPGKSACSLDVLDGLYASIIPRFMSTEQITLLNANAVDYTLNLEVHGSVTSGDTMSIICLKSSAEAVIAAALPANAAAPAADIPTFTREAALLSDANGAFLRVTATKAELSACKTDLAVTTALSGAKIEQRTLTAKVLKPAGN